MKKHLLSLLCLLTFALPGLADTWTYDVANDYNSPAWLNLIKSSTGTGDVKATSFDSADSELQTISWKYEQTGDAKTINKDGTSPKGIVMGSSTQQFSTVTFSTDAFKTKSISKVTIKIASVSKKCSYSVSLSCGNSSETKDKVLYQNNSGSANTLGTAEFTPNCIGENFSFTINQTGTTTNTKGGFKFCSVTIEFTENTNPSLPATCTPPTFNIEHNSKVPMGTVVRATCDTPNSTVTISGPGVAAPVVGEDKAGYAEFTLTEDKLNTEVVLTATATVEGENGPIKSDPTNIQFSVVEAPKTISDEITTTTLNLSGTSYTVYSQTSTSTKVEYKAKAALENKAIHINTGATSSGKNSGLTSVNNPDNLIIDSIIITIADGTPVLKMSNEAGSVTGSGTNAAVSAPTDAETITGTKSGNDIVYTPTKNFKYFTLTSDGNSHFSKVVVNYRKPEAPETTEVTLAWEDVKAEYTVGQESEIAILNVTPEEAYPFVKVTSSNEEVATATFDEGLVELNFLKASAEPVVITATVDDPNGKYVAKEDATFSFTVKDAEVVPEPEAIVVTPALDKDGYILVTTGTKITFSSNNAAKLSVSINGEEATLEANPFVFTATEDTGYEIVVIPVDSEGKIYEKLKLEANILAEKPTMTTSTYTFDFTKSSLLDTTPDYPSILPKYFYALSEGVGMFRISANIAQNNIGQFSYVDNAGWEFGIDETKGSSFYINILTTEGFDYEITSAKFNYADNESVEFSSMDNQTVNNEWIGKSTYIAVNVTAHKTVILNSIDVTFEHDVVKMPKLIGGTMEMGLALTHENDDHAVFFKITDAYGNDVTADRMLTGTVASAPARAISIDTDHEGHTPYTAGSEFTMKPADKLSTYAQHPHGMVSEVYSTTYEDIATGIGSIAADSETEVVYFNLQGVRVTEPTDGVYIRVENGKATKVIK